MIFSSHDFADYGPLDRMFTKEGDDVSPTFQIDDVPDGTQSLVITVHDLDSPGGKAWTHWLAWKLSPRIRSLSSRALPKGTIQGVNDFGDVGYGGPLPTVGSGDHRYVFSLYALDFIPKFDTTITRDDVLRHVAGHICAQSMWVGTYRRD